jgi:hypothetical protein
VTQLEILEEFCEAARWVPPPEQQVFAFMNKRDERLSERVQCGWKYYRPRPKKRRPVAIDIAYKRSWETRATEARGESWRKRRARQNAWYARKKAKLNGT